MLVVPSRPALFGAQEWGSDLELDVSDKDEMINLQSWPSIKGMYMPDAITTFKAGGKRCESGEHAGEQTEFVVLFAKDLAFFLFTKGRCTA